MCGGKQRLLVTADTPVAVNLWLQTYTVWQNDPAATLGNCLENLGIDTRSLYITHRAVLPYLGTMTSLVMRAGKQGVFVSFRWVGGWC